jgi:hypothetical protein
LFTENIFRALLIPKVWCPERGTMLSLEVILQKTEARYLKVRPWENKLRSEQIKALASVLVEEFNHELALIVSVMK